MSSKFNTETNQVHRVKAAREAGAPKVIEDDRAPTEEEMEAEKLRQAELKAQADREEVAAQEEVAYSPRVSYYSL
jgi:hypothetical protein